jgi:hypothetical protein
MFMKDPIKRADISKVQHELKMAINCRLEINKR